MKNTIISEFGKKEATAQGARPYDRHDCIADGYDYGAGVKESYERSYYEIY